MPDSTDRKLVVSIEGNLLYGVTSIIKGLADRQQSTYSLQAVYEPLKNIIHSVIGDIRWAQHKESQEGTSVCVLETSALFRQGSKTRHQAQHRCRHSGLIFVFSLPHVPFDVRHDSET